MAALSLGVYSSNQGRVSPDSPPPSDTPREGVTTTTSIKEDMIDRVTSLGTPLFRKYFPGPPVLTRQVGHWKCSLTLAERVAQLEGWTYQINCERPLRLNRRPLANFDSTKGYPGEGPAKVVLQAQPCPDDIMVCRVPRHYHKRKPLTGAARRAAEEKAAEAAAAGEPRIRTEPKMCKIQACDKPEHYHSAISLEGYTVPNEPTPVDLSASGWRFVPDEPSDRPTVVTLVEDRPERTPTSSLSPAIAVTPRLPDLEASDAHDQTPVRRSHSLSPATPGIPIDEIRQRRMASIPEEPTVAKVNVFLSTPSPPLFPKPHPPMTPEQVVAQQAQILAAMTPAARGVPPAIPARRIPPAIPARAVPKVPPAIPARKPPPAIPARKPPPAIPPLPTIPAAATLSGTAVQPTTKLAPANKVETVEIYMNAHVGESFLSRIKTKILDLVSHTEVLSDNSHTLEKVQRNKFQRRFGHSRFTLGARRDMRKLVMNDGKYGTSRRAVIYTELFNEIALKCIRYKALINGKISENLKQHATNFMTLSENFDSYMSGPNGHDICEDTVTYYAQFRAIQALKRELTCGPGAGIPIN